MKIYNIALTTLALMLSPAPILAKETVLAGTMQQTATFQSPPHQEQATNRYVVKFKAGSKEFETRMQQAASQHSGRKLRKSAAFGTFLPKENAEVLYLNSDQEVEEWKAKDDVEYVEPGKAHEGK